MGRGGSTTDDIGGARRSEGLAVDAREVEARVNAYGVHSPISVLAIILGMFRETRRYEVAKGTLEAIWEGIDWPQLGHDEAPEIGHALSNARKMRHGYIESPSRSEEDKVVRPGAYRPMRYKLTAKGKAHLDELRRNASTPQS
jgi:hypothetical protein